jgi:serine protease AprX
VCAAGNNGRYSPTIVDPNWLKDYGWDVGNEGYLANFGSIQSPGNDPYVITVGAMKTIDGVRADDRITTYSSRGPTRLDLVVKPDIVAPGNLVISTEAPGAALAVNYPTNEIPLSSYMKTTCTALSTNYFRLSGTSMSTPVVTGAIALMLQAHGNLTPDDVKARLMFSADKWTFPDGTGDICTFGAGYLDIPAALANTITVSAPALSPSLCPDSLGNLEINSNSGIMASHALWGNSAGIADLHAIWGKASLTSDNAAIDASHAIWGSCVLSNNSALTASHAIWGNTSVFNSSMTAVDLSSVVVNGE